jgi:hypothetical protein
VLTFDPGNFLLKSVLGQDKSRMQERQALVVDLTGGYLWTIPALLARAGFVVDIITTASPLVWSRRPGTRDVVRVGGIEELLCAIETYYCSDYDLVVLTEDDLIGAVRHSTLSMPIKLGVLPVTSERDFEHLFSKIGLSMRLQDAGIATPQFRVAADVDEAAAHASDLGYPVFLKADSANSGAGVLFCASEPELRSGIDCLKVRMGKGHIDQLFPLLIQEKIDGDLYDLSGFFRAGQLVHFAHAKVEDSSIFDFGPSGVRTYTQLAHVDPVVFDELRCIGQTLGLNGFANIACIRSRRDGRRYYLEADCRPTAWANYPCYYGDDPARAIQRYFECGAGIPYPYPLQAAFPEQILIGYPFRLKWRDLLLNRYGAWQTLVSFTGKEILVTLLRRFALEVRNTFR